MTRLIAGLAAAAALATPLAANAQPNRTVIRDSGNGVNNTIQVRNGFPGFQPPVPLFAPQNPGFQAGFGGGFQPGFGGPGFGGGFQPGFGGPVGGPGCQPGFGGGSGFGPGGGYPFGPGGFGVNVNVITNSGNGAGNTINTVNRGGPGGININVITNSGNGINNAIGIRNR